MSSRARYAAAVTVLVSALLAGCGGSGSGAPRIACVDSTDSTAGIRAGYLPGLEAVALAAAEDEAPFYAAACGANATGTVNWPVHKEFEIDGALSGDLAIESAKHSIKQLTPRLRRITRIASKRSGTPLGEMLAVAARQCAAVGGGCEVFLFTDGEWADRLLRVRYGVTRAEQQRYIATYAPRVRGLAGATVRFVGVGYGTSLGEVRLAAAEHVATVLVRAGGGKVGAWSTHLPMRGS